jgi:hypothetical protein
VELIPLPSLKAAALTGVIESIILLLALLAKRWCMVNNWLYMSDLMQPVLKLLQVRSSIAAAAGFHAKTSVAERYVRTVERCASNLSLF